MALAVDEIASAIWRCRQCRKHLGILTADALVVTHGRLRLRLPLASADHVVRWCERCGAANRLDDFALNYAENA